MKESKSYANAIAAMANMKNTVVCCSLIDIESQKHLC